jgi:fumarate reductase flavoprotein subunit
MLDPWIAGPNFYSIWSAAQIDAIRDRGFKHNLDGASAWRLGQGTAIPQDTPLPEAYDVLATAIGMGYVFKADTIEGLASFIGCNPSQLTATVSTYNGYCRSGSDREFGKDSQFLEPVGNGPYYAVKMASYSYGTIGGLDINARMQALDTSGRVIPGLFAIGNDSAGVLFTEKKPYVTFGGIDNGWALTSGYVGGAAAAAYAAGK